MKTIVLIGFLLGVAWQSPGQSKSTNMEIATLGGGCFWCTEAIFSELKGVKSVVSGYSGGDIVNPSYKEVCSGRTGHAEAVEIEFDPRQISFAEILEVFFETHDPTTLNRQGNDTGPQYRSAIFYHNNEQKEVAESIIRRLNAENVYAKKVITEVTPWKNFFKAEDYHQNYVARNPAQGYCQFVIIPKLEKFRKIFHDKLKAGVD